MVDKKQMNASGMSSRVRQEVRQILTESYKRLKLMVFMESSV